MHLKCPSFFLSIHIDMICRFLKGVTTLIRGHRLLLCNWSRMYLFNEEHTDIIGTINLPDDVELLITRILTSTQHSSPMFDSIY